MVDLKWEFGCFLVDICNAEYNILVLACAVKCKCFLWWVCYGHFSGIFSLDELKNVAVQIPQHVLRASREDSNWLMAILKLGDFWHFTRFVFFTLQRMHLMIWTSPKERWKISKKEWKLSSSFWGLRPLFYAGEIGNLLVCIKFYGMVCSQSTDDGIFNGCCYEICGSTLVYEIFGLNEH